MTQRRRKQPVMLPARGRATFPDPSGYDAEGLLAVGGDLSVERLLTAYRSGIFPWYAEGYLPLWWSPDPRVAFVPECLHVSRSLDKLLRRGEFELSWNRDFVGVMTACAEGRTDGTWILPEMVDAYVRLHELGHAHSLEVWCGGQLAGGIYGVQVGALFAAESMFHRVSGMSKVALVALVRSTFAAGIRCIDAQMPTPHLQSLGCRTVRRSRFLRDLPGLARQTVDLAGLVPAV